MKNLQVIFVSLLIFAGCESNDINPDNPNLTPLSASEQTLSSGGNDFSFNLMRQVTNTGQNAKPINLVLSPLSAQFALGMVLNGASGATADGIVQTINYNGLQANEINQGFLDMTKLLSTMDNKVVLDLANSVWFDKQLAVNTDFSNTIKNFYNGTVQSLDFNDPTAVETINNWVANKTNQAIKNLLSTTNGDVMVLVNAIYFKGAWKNKFGKSQTAFAPFYSEDGATSSVSTMYCKGASLTGYINNSLALYDIPYGNGQFSMTILLPARPSTVANILSTVSADSLNLWLHKADTIKGDLYLPKFKITSNIRLDTVLSKMGMRTAFSDSASFPFLFTKPLQVQITQVRQKAMIDTEEEGTTAAAATAISIGYTAVILPKQIRIEHPFIFLIREKHSGEEGKMQSSFHLLASVAS